MPRVDYYHDPNAPRPNSLVPAVTAVVLDDAKILLEHRVDNDRWALPGGVLEPGETITEAAVRETFEETGIEITVLGLVGVFSDPGHVIAYDDGEVRQQFSICLRAEPVRGTLRAQASEAKRVDWVPFADMDSLDIHPGQRTRIVHGIAWLPGAAAYLG